MKAISRRKFVAAAAVVGAGPVLRTPGFAFANQNTGVVSTGADKPMGPEVVASQVSPFPMKSVRLGPGVFNQAAEANRKYLKTVATDRLLHTFRLNAGMPSSPNHWGNGRSLIANCAATLPAGTIFRLARWRSPVPGTKNSNATATRW